MDGLYGCAALIGGQVVVVFGDWLTALAFMDECATTADCAVVMDMATQEVVAVGMALAV